jgi:hypothetical protein
MPLITGNRSLHRPSLVESIKKGLAVPIISDEVAFGLALATSKLPPDRSPAATPDAERAWHRHLVEAYADYSNYPATMTERGDQAKVCRYYKLAKQKTEEFTDDDLRADYLNFAKNFFYSVAQADGADEGSLNEAAAQIDTLSVSEFAQSLGYPHFDQRLDNPLLVLANLPFSTYLTTSPYRFVELALRKANKVPRSEFCRWRPDLDHIPSEIDDEAYRPSEKTPLVYHLTGLDTVFSSLVLTEDDWLDLLVRISHCKDDDRRDSIPAMVRGGLYNALLVLGFSLDSWAFRVLYAGLIKLYQRPGSTERRGVCSLQLIPSEAEKTYLQDYLQREAKFDVFWGGLGQYAQELRKL